MRVTLEIEGQRADLVDRLELSEWHINLPKGMCLPEKLEKGEFYKFNIKEWKIFPFRPIQLFSLGEDQPLASIDITEQTAYLLAGDVHTRGEYFVRVIGKT